MMATNQSMGVQRRFSDRDADAWATRVDALRSAAQTATGTVKIGAAAHSVRAVPAASLARMAECVGDQTLHVHLSEQPAENAAAEAFLRLLTDRAAGPERTSG